MLRGVAALRAECKFFCCFLAEYDPDFDNFSVLAQVALGTSVSRSF